MVIQLHCSVDDETFMAQMNVDVGSSFAAEHGNGGDGEEEEYAVDEHGEGLIEPPVGRTVNYNTDEEIVQSHLLLYLF